MEKITAWDVVHYGYLMDRHDSKVGGNFVTQKVYKYEQRFFVETWSNGVRLFFGEVS